MPNPKNQTTPLYILQAIILAISAPLASAQPILFVNAQASGANTGLSWADAFVDLQDGLDFARSPEGANVREIWVAAGTYKPDRGTGDPTMSFELVDGVGLFGGFAGVEASLDQRNWTLNETILTGDILDNDLTEFEFSNPCCYEHDGPGCGSQACEGVLSSSFPSPLCPIVADFPCSCFMTDWSKECADYAQILCCEQCMPDRCDNTFTILKAQSTHGETTEIDGFIVRGGNTRQAYWQAPFSIKDGGVTIKNCVFEGNIGWYGSAIIIDAFEAGELTKLTNCIFHNNFGTIGALYIFQSDVTIIDCSFVVNRSSRGAAAVSISGGAGLVTCRNCRFDHNNAAQSRAIAGDGLELEDCLFIGNSRGAVNSQSGAAPTIIRRCVFRDHPLGALGTSFVAPAYIFDSQFLNNHNSVAVALNAGGVVANCLFAGNDDDGALKVRDGLTGPPLILHSLFLNNFNLGSANSAAIIDHSTSGAQISSCIFIGNANSAGRGEFAQIDQFADGSPSVDHSIVEGWSGNFPGEGSFDADPMFVDIIGPDGIPYTGDEDYRLRPESPAINTGDPNPPAIPVHDLDGHPRVLCGAPDIGPYEFGIGDFDCDLSVSLIDFSGWQSCMTGPGIEFHLAGCEAFDFNADSAIDLFDFSGWQNTYVGG